MHIGQNQGRVNKSNLGFSCIIDGEAHVEMCTLHEISAGLDYVAKPRQGLHFLSSSTYRLSACDEMKCFAKLAFLT